MWTKIVCVVLAFSFIAVVFAYGTGQKYDAWAHMEKIVTSIDGAPMLEDIATYWTADGWYIEEKVGTNYAPIYIGGQIIERPLLPPRVDGEDNMVNRVYIEPEKVTDSDWGVFEPIQSFFGAVKGFFVRMYYTIRWIVDVILFAFKMVTLIAPWNGYVKEV